MKRYILSSRAGAFRFLALFTSLFIAVAKAQAQSDPGYALNVVDTLNYVAVSQTASFNSLPLTVMFWVKTGVTTGQQGLVNKYVANSLNGWNVFLLNGRVRAWYFVSSTRNVFGGGDGLDGGFIADNNWHHITLVVDSSGASLYVDGINRHSRLWTGAFGASTTSQEVRIGSYPGGNTGFVGTIFLDDVSVWNVGLAPGDIAFSRNGRLTGLEGSRIVYYRCDEGSGTLVADSAPLSGNNNGTWVGLSWFSRIFPFVQTSSAGAVGATQATLIGVVNPNRATVTPGFEWGATTNYGNTVAFGTKGGAATAVGLGFNSTVTGLTPGTEYHYRASVSNIVGLQFGTDQSFRTLGPTVATLPAGAVNLTSATMNGTANPRGTSANAWFEFGATTNYGGATPTQAMGSGSADVNFSGALTGLPLGTTFHYRAVASNSLGATYGVDQNFKTLGPAVETLAPGGVTQTAATVNGVASPAGTSATVWFEWGMTTAYGNTTAPRAVSGGVPVNFSETIPNLFPGGVFHYRAVLALVGNMVTGTNQTFTTPVDPAVRVMLGGVMVTVQPPEAVAEGARWSLDNGPEMFPDFTLGLVMPGRHTVRMRNLPNWLAPPPVELSVVGGKTSAVVVAFTPIPTFALGTVPEQHARAGRTLEFLVNGVPPGAQLQVTGTPPPSAGSFSFDPVTGRVSYTAGATDRLPFTLTYLVNGVPAGTSTITPLQNLPPEEVVINYDRPLPNDESRDYITISETPSAGPVLFNGVTNQVLTVDISGKTLVFGAGHTARLLEAYTDRRNIQEFRLYADRVIIRSPLVLPQTHVTIRARELRFEGDGVINTTPLALQLKPGSISPLAWSSNVFTAPGGFAGHNGGDADVFVERFFADSTTPTRFILLGGMGGPPGEGRNGYDEGVGFPNPADGGATFVPMFIGDTNWAKLMIRAGNSTNCGFRDNALKLYEQHYTRIGNVFTGTNYICGDPNSVATGEPGVPAGLPGPGGRGGMVRSTLDLRSYVSQAGGPPGDQGGSNYIGGTLSFNYIHFYLLTSTLNGNTTVIPSARPAPKVRGATAIAPTGTNGAPGGFALVSDSAAWLHSFGLRAVTRFAKDAYLNGRVEETRTLLVEHLDILRVLQPVVLNITNLTDAEFAEATSLDQLVQEMSAIVTRIDVNLDYFGNPAGWVPMLSFEANQAVFEEEITRSIPILYLAYWLNYSATNFQNSAAASLEAAKKLRIEFGRMVVAYNEAETILPSLKQQSADITDRIGTLRTRLSELEAQLVARAHQNVEDSHKLPFWKKALGILSVAADLVPIGQPTVGKIGAGLAALAKIDPEHPVQSALNLTNAFEFTANKNISLCFSGSTNNSANTSNSTTNSPAKRHKLKLSEECGKFLQAELNEIAAVFKEVQVDSKELQAEIEKLKASDAVFQAAVAQLIVLNKDKESVATALMTTLQSLATLTSEMTESTAATDDMDNRAALQLAALDHNALVHIKEMERRAMDRLLKFQYFTAKAFQYRLLRPFEGDLNLNRLFDRFQVLVGGTTNHVISDQEFANLGNLFRAELANTVNAVMSELNANAPSSESPRSFDLTAAELQTLNTTNQLVINLNQRIPRVFPSTREDVRIVNLRVTAIRAHPVGGPLGGDAALFLDFNHLGESRLTRNGQNFRFRHYQSATASPISWTLTFDPLHRETNNSVLGTSSGSLLKAILSQPTDANMLLFSRPAADADILIRREMISDNGIDLVIDGLTLQVDYEFALQSPSRRTLDVQVQDGLQPIIVLSQTDVRGRRDGQGNFRRVYPEGLSHTLQAPAFYGGRPFDRWVVQGQPQAAGVNAVTFELDTGITAEARYGELSSSNAPPSITQQPANQVAVLGATATFTVAASGAGPLTFRWQKNGAAMSDGGRIAGAATATLVISNIGLTDAAAYSVVISNAFGTRTSPAALLTVIAPSVSLLQAGPGSVGFQFPTVAGLSYLIERKFRLEDPAWEQAQVITGTGGLVQFTRPTTAGSAFFRLRVE